MRLSNGGLKRCFLRFGWLVAGLACGGQAVAAPACSTYYCSDVMITLFIPMADGTVYIDTDGAESALSCSLYGGVQMTLTASGNDRLYSFLMTAYFQKSRVMIRINENSAGCTIAYAY